MAKQTYKVGEIFNGVHFLEEVPKVGKQRRGKFSCPHCENIFEARLSHVVNGLISSCGCFWNGKKKHGATNSEGFRSPEYKCWSSMMRRVRENAEPKRKKVYFDQGIRVCERWEDFNLFLEDMGSRPSPKHTLDRYPNKRGNYEPGNVRWATAKEQARNTTWNLEVLYRGEIKTLQEWCEILGLQYNRMRERIFKKKMKPEDAFTLPRRYDQVPNLFISHSFGVIAA